MNNKELIASLSARLGWNQFETERMLLAFSSVLSDRLADSDTVSLPDFGQFEVRKKMERITVNPVSGKRYLVPPKIVPTFRPVQQLKGRFKRKDDNGE